jgi:hypothetical protein
MCIFVIDQCIAQMHVKFVIDQCIAQMLVKFVIDQSMALLRKPRDLFKEGAVTVASAVSLVSEELKDKPVGGAFPKKSSIQFVNHMLVKKVVISTHGSAPIFLGARKVVQSSLPSSDWALSVDSSVSGIKVTISSFVYM